MGTTRARHSAPYRTRRTRAAARTLAGVVCGLFACTAPARALVIELKDVAADRVERQRNFAEGALPLPGTPNVAQLDQRLKETGVRLGSPMLIRVFKAESELEVWKEKGSELVLFATYPICHWSGSLGPKLRQGDKQAPEGFYTLTRKQLHHSVRWPRSLQINFPNILDQAEARTGSDILIHGGCTSVGCFAMTNPVSDEIHRLTSATLEAGQDHIPVHIFPFRMTDEKMKAHQSPAWQAFWANLKEGYDLFEKTKHPPRVSACAGRYLFTPASTNTESGPLEACQTTVAAIKEQDDWLNGVPPAPAPVRAPSLGTPMVRTAAAEIGAMRLGATPSVTDAPVGAPSQLTAPAARPSGAETAAQVQEPAPVRCRWALPVCRKTATLKGIQAARRAALFASGWRRTALTSPAPTAAARP